MDYKSPRTRKACFPKLAKLSCFARLNEARSSRFFAKGRKNFKVNVNGNDNNWILVPVDFRIHRMILAGLWPAADSISAINDSGITNPREHKNRKSPTTRYRLYDPSSSLFIDRIILFVYRVFHPHLSNVLVQRLSFFFKKLSLLWVFRVSISVYSTFNIRELWVLHLVKLFLLSIWYVGKKMYFCLT